VEAAEEEAICVMNKITCLCKQCKEWEEKAVRAISYGIKDLGELERVKCEEQEAEAACQAALSAPNPISVGPS
jgi:hypothetical protein